MKIKLKIINEDNLNYEKNENLKSKTNLKKIK